MYSIRILYTTSVVLMLFKYSHQDDIKQYQEQLEANKKVCVKEVGLDEGIANDMLLGKLAEDNKAKCFTKCMATKGGYMTVDGKIDVEFLKAHPKPGVAPEKLNLIVEKCVSVEDADGCNKAFKFVSCVNDILKA